MFHSPNPEYLISFIYTNEQLVHMVVISFLCMSKVGVILVYTVYFCYYHNNIFVDYGRVYIVMVYELRIDKWL